jgi:hypothetical protein
MEGVNHSPSQFLFVSRHHQALVAKILLFLYPGAQIELQH